MSPAGRPIFQTGISVSIIEGGQWTRADSGGAVQCGAVARVCGGDLPGRGRGDRVGAVAGATTPELPELGIWLVFPSLGFAAHPQGGGADRARMLAGNAMLSLAAILLAAVPLAAVPTVLDAQRRRPGARALRRQPDRRLLDAADPVEVATLLLGGARRDLPARPGQPGADRGRGPNRRAPRRPRGRRDAQASVANVALDREPSGINAAVREGRRSRSTTPSSGSTNQRLNKIAKAEAAALHRPGTRSGWSASSSARFAARASSRRAMSRGCGRSRARPAWRSSARARRPHSARRWSAGG